MKMKGSNLRDTLVGTPSGDTITALGGNDLIATAGGIDTILAGSGDDMITGFSYKLTPDKGDTGTDTGGDTGGDTGNIGGRASQGSAGASITVDGGAGSHDIILVELSASKGTSEVDDFKKAVTVKNVEEFIYNFATLSAGQEILGSNSSKGLETIVVGSGTANINTRGGDDFVYTAEGDDVINTGKGSDFIHAGEGHNTVTSGSGTDYFHFHLTDTYQYTNITDFEAGVDKILITLDVDQINLIRGANYESPLPVRGYGDGMQGVGDVLNAYVSYNHGREFDPDDFTSSDPNMAFDDWAFYEQETGSIFVIHYEDHSTWIETEVVLVAHVEPGTAIDQSDFSFRMI
jgi:hypothetical protein